MAMLNNQMAICSPKKFNEIPIFADNHRVATGLGVDGPNLRALKWRASVVLLNAAATHRVGVNSILYNVAISSCERSTQWEHAPWEILANFWFGAERALNIFEWFHLFLYRMNTNNKFNLRLLRCFSTSSNVDRHNTILESTMCSILFSMRGEIRDSGFACVSATREFNCKRRAGVLGPMRKSLGKARLSGEKHEKTRKRRRK